MSRFSDIDFVEARRLPPGAGIALGLLLVALVLAGWRYAALRSAIASTGDQIRILQQHTESPAPVRQDAAIAKPRALAVNTAVAALNTPWPALLGAIETVRSEHVQLTQLEPLPRERYMLVVAQAESMDELISFMKTLAATPPFTQARPLHQELIPGSGQMRAQASFHLHWEDYR